MKYGIHVVAEADFGTVGCVEADSKTSAAQKLGLKTGPHVVGAEPSWFTTLGSRVDFDELPPEVTCYDQLATRIGEARFRRERELQLERYRKQA